MKVLLIAGGVLLLLLAFFLMAAAAVVFVIARSRRAKASPGPSAQPESPVRSAAPVPAPMPSADAVQPVAPAALPHDMADPSRTIAVPVARSLGALYGTSGPVKGRVFPLDVDGFYIGRDHSVAQLLIDEPKVSKRHAWVGWRDGVLVVTDLQSTNGTFLNSPNTRITEARLAPGDTIIISDDVARLTYRNDG
jgi:hypothetical protein